MPKSIIESYKVISKGILLALKELGVKAEMKEDIKKTKNKNAICFNEPSYYEITANNKKIVGSAQTRKNKKLLQHGSILIDIDIKKLISLFNVKNQKQTIKDSKKRITSINKESTDTDYDKVKKAMKIGFEKNLKITLKENKLTKEELNLAKNLSKTKYSTKEWNFR
jgi:lipoate-protein ligase A